MESVAVVGARGRIATLKAQERATAARAEASERLSEQIVASLTSGLIVVDGDNRVKIINPAARRMLSLGEVDEDAEPPEQLLTQVPALLDVIAECLEGKVPVVRRGIAIAWRRHDAPRRQRFTTRRMANRQAPFACSAI